MTWYKFTITQNQIIAGANHQILDDFLRRTMGASLLEVDQAALFATSKPKPDGSTDFYITPTMAEMADDLIEKWGAASCEQPPKDILALVVGHDSAWNLFE